MISINKNIQWNRGDAKTTIEIFDLVNSELSAIDGKILHLSEEDRVELRRFIGLILGSIISEIVLPVRETFDDL